MNRARVVGGSGRSLLFVGVVEKINGHASFDRLVTWPLKLSMEESKKALLHDGRLLRA